MADFYGLMVIMKTNKIINRHQRSISLSETAVGVYSPLSGTKTAIAVFNAGTAKIG